MYNLKNVFTNQVINIVDIISKTDWSLLRPVDFSIQGDNFLNFINGNTLENKQERIV